MKNQKSIKPLQYLWTGMPFYFSDPPEYQVRTPYFNSVWAWWKSVDTIKNNARGHWPAVITPEKIKGHPDYSSESDQEDFSAPIRLESLKKKLFWPLPIRHKPTKILTANLQNHTLILGATGKGKSYALSKLISNTLQSDTDSSSESLIKGPAQHHDLHWPSIITGNKNHLPALGLFEVEAWPIAVDEELSASHPAMALSFFLELVRVNHHEDEVLIDKAARQVAEAILGFKSPDGLDLEFFKNWMESPWVQSMPLIAQKVEAFLPIIKEQWEIEKSLQHIGTASKEQSNIDSESCGLSPIPKVRRL